jgi:hypothetical protein
MMKRMTERKWLRYSISSSLFFRFFRLLTPREKIHQAHNRWKEDHEQAELEALTHRVMSAVEEEERLAEARRRRMKRVLEGRQTGKLDAAALFGNAS